MIQGEIQWNALIIIREAIPNIYKRVTRGIYTKVVSLPPEIIKEQQLYMIPTYN